MIAMKDSNPKISKLSAKISKDCVVTLNVGHGLSTEDPYVRKQFVHSVSRVLARSCKHRGETERANSPTLTQSGNGKLR